MKKANIFAHRGRWNNNNEKNKMIALSSALQAGYSIETDIRDYQGSLCISHDPPSQDEIGSLDELLGFYKSRNCKSKLALNVKADGIQYLIKEKLTSYNITDYFLFDMSIPDHLKYKEMGLKEYMRVSEHESYEVLERTSEGIWYDFKRYTRPNIIGANRFLKKNQRLNFVSPELHGYTDMRATVWGIIREQGFHRLDTFELCTDYPDEAYNYFMT